MFWQDRTVTEPRAGSPDDSAPQSAPADPVTGAAAAGPISLAKPGATAARADGHREAAGPDDLPASAPGGDGYPPLYPPPEHSVFPLGVPADPNAYPVLHPTGYVTVPPRTARDRVLEGLTSLAVVAVLVGLGAALAPLWARIGPHVKLIMTDGGPAYLDAEPEGYAANEGTFIFAGAAVGVLTAIAVWVLLRRHRGPVQLAALTLGSICGAGLMAYVGHRIGLTEYTRLLKDAPVGRVFERPVELRMMVWHPFQWRIQGAVLVQAVLAVATYTLLAGFSASPTLGPLPLPEQYDPFSSGSLVATGQPASPAPPAAD
jgi:hypothetical protein